MEPNESSWCCGKQIFIKVNYIPLHIPIFWFVWSRREKEEVLQKNLITCVANWCMHPWGW